jgi:hypothetical protein
MVLSMGIADWQLSVVRARGRSLLREHNELHTFARRVRVALLSAMGRYAFVLVGVTLIAVAAAQHTTAIYLRAATFAALGLAFFGGLVLVSLGHVLRVCSAQLLALIALQAGRLGLAGERALILQLLVCTSLALLLSGAALRSVAVPTAHR